ncbi:MAG TPA: hypothetical protein VH393_00220 [Ktedonobacterales bacterium]
MSEAVIQIVALLGSLAVLAAYGASQTRRLFTASLPYVLLNLLGSGALATVAIIARQWGFLLLEGVWALVSLWSLLQHVRGRALQPTGH